MAELTRLSGSEELVEAIKNVKRDNTRIFKIVIVDEELQLADLVRQDSSASLDFKKVPSLLSADEPCFVVFRNKEVTLSSPFVLILYVPDDAAVRQRMLYASSKLSVRKLFGRNDFSKEKEYSEIDEITWRSLQEGDAVKPWSTRELSSIELDRQEEVARGEARDRGHSGGASGFGSVELDLTQSAVASLNDLKLNRCNWAQLTLTPNHEEIDCVETKTINQNELSRHVSDNEPQFYLYNYDGSIVLIYCCPDENTSVKNRMVYSTCKASFSDQIKRNGINIVKKLNIRSSSELTTTLLREETSRNTATAFRPTANMFENRNNSIGNSNVKTRLSNPRAVPEGGTGSALRIIGGNNNRQLPKGVVLPPRGAYC
eukprot:TRINITY_DN12064_c0_g1_i1.p1 TRINITY_DN12064_c0_g1~~TRINITY_DN12064_c0_g1_i1.p1  ORF type:complete len:373 (-),score=76.50 TRINITY_DN12064_c0_g1_i1:52-1170(-)